MSNPYEMFETDGSAESNGVWQDYGDFQIKVARMGRGNRLFQKTYERKTAPHRKAMQTGMLDEKVAERLLNETTAETIIKGWRTRWKGEWKDNTVVVKNADGEVELVDATVDNVLKVLTDLPELAADIRDVATSLENYRVSNREDDAKN